MSMQSYLFFILNQSGLRLPLGLPARQLLDDYIGTKHIEEQQYQGCVFDWSHLTPTEGLWKDLEINIHD